MSGETSTYPTTENHGLTDSVWGRLLPEVVATAASINYAGDSAMSPEDYAMAAIENLLKNPKSCTEIVARDGEPGLARYARRATRNKVIDRTRHDAIIKLTTLGSETPDHVEATPRSFRGRSEMSAHEGYQTDVEAKATEAHGKQMLELFDGIDCPTKFSVPVILKYAYGYTQKEVAEALDIKVGTARTRIRRGLDRIRKAHGIQEGKTPLFDIFAVEADTEKDS